MDTNWFSIRDSQVPSVERIDAFIDFPSNESFGDPLLRNFFKARWTGKLRIAREGEYTFYLSSDGAEQHESEAGGRFPSELCHPSVAHRRFPLQPARSYRMSEKR